MSRIDMTGWRFGSLHVLEFSHSNGDHAWWRVGCDCGATRAACGHTLRRGLIRSCGPGCPYYPRRVHGHTVSRQETAEYRAWRCMKRRCSEPKRENYPWYGGAGISVCPQWLNSFETFLADVGPRPSPRHSIDRIDNAGNYEPGNVRWATKREQNLNRRMTVNISFGGVTRSRVEWAELIGLPYNTLRNRQMHGWPLEKALTTPARKKKAACEVAR